MATTMEFRKAERRAGLPRPEGRGRGDVGQRVQTSRHEMVGSGDLT